MMHRWIIACSLALPVLASAAPAVAETWVLWMRSTRVYETIGARVPQVRHDPPEPMETFATQAACRALIRTFIAEATAPGYAFLKARFGGDDQWDWKEATVNVTESRRQTVLVVTLPRALLTDAQITTIYECWPVGVNPK